MFRIKTWIPVEIEPEEDMLYPTIDEAEKEKAQLAEMQPENRYEIEEVGMVVSECQNCGAELLLARVNDHRAVGICDGCGSKIEECKEG